ncbi:MAG: methylmalonyl-CoA mutase family protein [Nitrospinae bacterium]|nr:methylmalonyl-CoA mutase family protein [Nitrospinota bacterium]
MDSERKREIVYTPSHLGEFDYSTQMGLPGEYPYVRGIQPTMYRGRLWTMRQYAGFGTAEESNRRYKYLLEQGQTGLSVAFDLPTQMGYDSDHPLAAGEVGKVGVAIDTLEDMETLFQDIPLDQISTSMTINATASILLAMYIAVAEKQGVRQDQLRGTIQNDILKEYIARGTYIYPPRPSMRLITDVFRYGSRNLPQWNFISISGYHIREAGADAVQELAFTLANGVTYVQTALEAGLQVDDFAPRLSFFFNVHNDFLEEVAKFRASRRMWAKIMRERFRARKADSWKMRFHCQTAGSTLTAQQPQNNIVRVALQALAAVLGGAQSLHTNSWDEALSLPTEEAVRLALRTQQIIAYESGAAHMVDPLGGSYALEALTSELERKAWDYIAEIEARGGVLKAIEQGYIQREIQESAYRYQQAVEQGEMVVVGINRFSSSEAESSAKLLKVDPALEQKQRGKLARAKERRDGQRVKAALAGLKEAAQGEANLMPLILEAVKAYTTLGEISDSWREVFGVYREVKTF